MRSDEKLDIRRHAIGRVEIYEITEDELERIQTECMDVGQDFQFATVCGTAFISFLTSLILTRIDSDRVFGIFVIVTILTFLGTAYFGVRYCRKKKTFVPVIQRIRERQVGPVGTEDEVLSASVVANLPVVPGGGIAPAAAPEAVGPETATAAHDGDVVVASEAVDVTAEAATVAAQTIAPTHQAVEAETEPK